MSALNISFDFSSAAGLAAFDAFMVSRSYLVGFAPSAADATAVEAIGSAPDAATYPNVARYFKHISAFKAGAKAKWAAADYVTAGTAVAAAPAAAAPAPAAKGNNAGSDSDSDGDDDLFGGDSDSDDGAVVAAPAPAPAKKKAKKKKIEKTQLTFYVSPEEAPADMEALEASVRTVEMEGLLWGIEFGCEDIGYGIQRLHVQCTIVNDLVGVDDVTDAVLELPLVGSTAPGTMNRLG